MFTFDQPQPLQPPDILALCYNDVSDMSELAQGIIAELWADVESPLYFKDKAAFKELQEVAFFHLNKCETLKKRILYGIDLPPEFFKFSTLKPLVVSTIKESVETEEFYSYFGADDLSNIKALRQLQGDYTETIKEVHRFLFRSEYVEPVKENKPKRWSHIKKREIKDHRNS